MVKGVSAARLARWFNEEGGGYRPSKDVREACIFSIHDLARDPPFSRLDLVICRNLLIYMSAELQKRILHKFHYALKPQGYLFLGSSENVGSNSELFTQVDKKHRLFQRRETNQPVSTDLSLPAVAPQRPADASADEDPAHSNEYQIEHEVRRVMDPYGPAYFAVDTQHQILRFSGGSVGQYLEPASGVASLNLFDLLKQALRPAVRSALHEAFENRQAVTRDDLALHLDGRTRPLDLIVEFIPANRLHGDLCVVAFRQVAPRAEADTQAAPAADRSELEQKLHATQSELRAANAELVALQEDSKAVTEEYQSINEELQSSNEELETSKEELQSVNEELQTVNNELEHKNQQLGELNSDLRNLLESTEIATIFLDKDFRIKNYTPAISDLFYLRASDVNRPLSEITGRLDYSALKRDVETVLRKLTVVEREVSLDDGRTFIMNIRLYRTVSDVINGVVITFFDISERKRYEAQRAWLAAIVEGSYEAILSADLDGYITTWNAAAERIFGYSQGEALGQPLPRFLVGQDEAGDDPELAAIWRLEDQPTRLERTIRRKDGQPIEITLTASLVKDQSGQATAIALVVQDITERSHEEAHRELLLHELSHRVKNMLATIQAIMNQTLNRAPSLEAFGQVFSQRLQGLAQTHSLLSQSEWQGVDLRQLVETTLEPYAGAGDNGYQVRGPDLTLAPQQAVSLGMALHELTTNAVKYGALAAAGGHIDIAWERVDDESGPMLKLRWQENTKQPIEAPANKGLGRTLIEDGLAHELDAQVGLEFKTQGAHCGIDMPLQPSH
jgi:two-component system CheB/CheR fusion protein